MLIAIRYGNVQSDYVKKRILKPYFNAFCLEHQSLVVIDYFLFDFLFLLERETNLRRRGRRRNVIFIVFFFFFPFERKWNLSEESLLLQTSPQLVISLEVQTKLFLRNVLVKTLRLASSLLHQLFFERRNLNLCFTLGL